MRACVLVPFCCVAFFIVASAAASADNDLSFVSVKQAQGSRSPRRAAIRRQWNEWTSEYYEGGYWDEYLNRTAEEKKNTKTVMYKNKDNFATNLMAGTRTAFLEEGIASENRTGSGSSEGTSDALKEVTGGQRHEDLLQIMSGMDLLIAKGSTPDWEKSLPHHEHYFHALKNRLQYLFFSDACAQFFNTDTQRWTTCCALGLRKNKEIGFCGTNLGMGLPVPCRVPDVGKDYGALGARHPVHLEEANAANVDAWKCNALHVSVRSKRKEQDLHATLEGSRLDAGQNLVQAPQAVDSAKFAATAGTVKRTSKNTLNFENTAPVSRQTIEIIPVEASEAAQLKVASSDLQAITVSDELTITTYKPVVVSQNLCGDRPLLSACYLACCDSLYRLTPFCKKNMSCY